MKNHMNGILGTIIFHMLLVVMFLILQIRSERRERMREMVVEFMESEMPELSREEEADGEEVNLPVRQALMERTRNIPVNISRKLEEELSTKEYEERMLRELEENRPEEYKKLQERLSNLEAEYREVLEEPEPVEEEPPAYEGPTRIYYDLKDRHHLYLHLPVYLCEGSGVVEVVLNVNQKGYVTRVSVPDLGDDMNALCLAEAAREAAAQSRFNPDPSAPPSQEGSITYHFVAQ